MTQRPLRIGVLGGVPNSLGGGGLEVQIEMTTAALVERGHDAFPVSERSFAEFDVLHAFGNDVAVWQHLRHWRRNRTPLVVSPVLVVEEGREEWIVRALNKLPWRGTEGSMRRELLRRADTLVALTEHERALLRRLAPDVRCVVVGNGVQALDPDTTEWATDPIPAHAAVLLGTVSARKQQIAAIDAIGRTDYVPLVVGAAETPSIEAELVTSLAATGGRWLGEVRSPAAVRGVLTESAVLVHLSRAEGQSLAILEALSVGLPVVVSNIPSHRELADEYPQHVHLCSRAEDLPGVLASLDATPPPPPHIPQWTDVAQDLERVYYSLLPD